MISARIPETSDGIQDEITVEQYDMMQKGLLNAGHLTAESLCQSGIQSGTALEIGPGPGYYGLEWLKATSGTNLIGVEISPAMIRLEQKNAAAYGISRREDYRQGNALSLQLDDASVDAVFSNGSLHEWEDAGKVFDGIARVLRPGGKYCITDLRRDLTREIYQFMYTACEPAEIRPGFASSVSAAYTKKEIEAVLKGSRLNGWKVIAHPYGLVISGRVS
jgi:ubiquinone/menaquinone biosynthesis C-methylase UbiE